MCVSFRVGKVVNILAKVNRAFTSSMEVGGCLLVLSACLKFILFHKEMQRRWCFFKFQVGIFVTCEDLYTGRQWNVCHAFATFVARRTEAGKVKSRGKSWVSTQVLSRSWYKIYTRACYMYPGTAASGDSSYTNGADGVQPGSRAAEDEAHPR